MSLVNLNAHKTGEDKWRQRTEAAQFVPNRKGGQGCRLHVKPLCPLPWRLSRGCRQGTRVCPCPRALLRAELVDSRQRALARRLGELVAGKGEAQIWSQRLRLAGLHHSSTPSCSRFSTFFKHQRVKESVTEVTDTLSVCFLALPTDECGVWPLPSQPR